MPEIVLNCQKLQCPEPVIQVKKCLEADPPEKIRVTVDNEAAVENVTRFLSSQGYAVVNAGAGPGLWSVAGTRGSGESGGMTKSQTAPHAASHAEHAAERKILIFIPTAVLGAGDDELGERLMKNFLTTLPEMGNDLWRIVLVNGGVTLAVEDSPVLVALQALEAAGVSILVCGACLEYYKLLAKKSVGQTTNMLDIVTSLQLADSVVRV